MAASVRLTGHAGAGAFRVFMKKPLSYCHPETDLKSSWIKTTCPVKLAFSVS
jgi:hypothetical protein